MNRMHHASRGALRLLLCTAFAVLLFSTSAHAISSRFEDATAWEDTPGLNLGPTGIGARLESKSFVVMNVADGSPAAGLVQKGDRIVGVNGKGFETPHSFGFDWAKAAQYGYRGPMMDFGNAIEDSEGMDGTLTLTIVRSGKNVETKLKLRPLGRFSPTFPFNCKKSDLIYREICQFVASNPNHIKQAGIGSAVAGLVLLGSRKPEYMPNVTRIANAMKDTKPFDGGLYNWPLCYVGIFLGEYYLVTRDASVLEALRNVAAGLEFSQSADYSFCHRKKDPNNQAYNELGVMNGQAGMAWGLARLCGVPVDDHRYEMLLKRIRYITRSDGCVSYARASIPEWEEKATMTFKGPSRPEESCGRSGAAVLAFRLTGLADQSTNDYISNVCRFMTEYKEYFPDTHCNPEIGMQWMGLALASSYPDGFRKVMDYHKAWFNLARTHVPGKFVCMPCRSNGWTYKWSLESGDWMSATMGLLFGVVKEKGLVIAGGPVPAPPGAKSAEKKASVPKTQPPPAPAMAEAALTVPEEVLAEWRARLIARIAAAAKAGKPLDGWVNVNGKGATYPLVGADENTLQVKVSGNVMPVAWRWLKSPDVLALVKSIASETDADSLLLMAVYLFANGQREAGETALAQAALLDPVVADRFREQFKKRE